MSIDTTKIIHAPVGGGRYTVTAPIVKEDYGLYLLIEGLELPSTYEVDFSNSENSGTSVTMIGNADGVLIPHQFIDSGKDVFAFLYHVGANYGRTVYKFRIPNKLRPDRTDEEPTPEEQSTIDQAISALNSAVSATAQDVIDADASAQESAESARASANSAVQASLSESNAERAKGNAQASAESASASATASAQSASQSAQIKTDVESMVDDAQASASASAQSATASANSASQASASAQSASSYATNAQGYASSAQTSAQTASTKATEASTSASTASAKATESAQSATNAQTYATQAESAKTASQTAQTASESARDSAITAQESAEDARDEAQSIVDGISGKVEQIDANTADIASLEEDRYKPYVTDSASGSIASFVDGADDIPLKSLVVNIDPVQDLHGYDSPWVAGGGKNLCPPLPSQTANGITITTDANGVSHISGTVTSTKDFVIELPSPVNGTFTFSANNSVAFSGRTNTYFDLLDSNNNSLGSSTLISADRRKTVTGEIAKIKIRFQTGLEIPNGFTMALQLELGSTATDYVPYENICPISGWTGANVNATGKNLWGGEKMANDMVDAVNDASKCSKGTDSDGAYVKLVAHSAIGKDLSGDLKFKPNTPYTFVVKGKRNNTNKQSLLRFKYTDGTTSEIILADTVVANTIYTNAFTSNPNKTIKSVFGYYASGESYLYYSDCGLFEGVLTADQFEPYNGTTLPINWQTEVGTVYGGKLDVLSGVLRVDRQYIKFDGSEDEIWYTYSSTGYRVPKRDIGLSGSGICNLAPTVSSASTYGVMFSASANYIYFFQSVSRWGVATVADLRAWLVTNNVEVCYELATPIEIQLTPNQVNSLLGVNNIWADSGDAEVVYRADTKAWIQRKIAEAIASLT